MEVLEKTQRKVVVRQRRHEVLRAVVGCLLLALLFYLLDAKHPKSSLYCTRHAVLPDNELEAAKGLHVEDIDCSLIVRPTRTALDLSFFGEISYSFEIVSARLVRPPSRPTDKDPCRKQCSRGKPCRCRDGNKSNNGGNRARKRRLIKEGGPSPEIEVAAAEGDAGEGKGGGGGERSGGVQHPHHSLHMGVNDVATLVLEDNQGITYDFYTFQDEAVAERMLENVQSFIREARADGSTSDSNTNGGEGEGGGEGAAGGAGAAATEQAPLELEVLYDDSWLDEMACALFLVVALVLMTRPYVEVVEFNADSGAMALDRWNLFHCGVFRYSCALENVNKLEITESNVYMMSAHAFEHLRQTKEFGLRVIFSLPLASPGTAAALSPVAHGGTNASVPASSAEGGGTAGFDAGSGTGGGGGRGGGRATVHAAVVLPASRVGASAPPPPPPPPPPRRRQWGVFFRRLVCWRGAGRRFWGGRRWWRRPATRGIPSTSAGFMYLDLLFGMKELDDRKLRRSVKLINDLLLRFGSDVEVAGGQKKEGTCCVCFRRRSRVVTFPCMHMATCPQCSETLSVCPLCRASISEKHTVFL